MKALWALQAATVHEIRARLLPERPLAYTTVMTVMGRLVQKGVAERQKRGRSHVYRSLVTESDIREHVLNQFVENFFQGSRDDLRRHLENGGRPPTHAVPLERAPAGEMKPTVREAAVSTARVADIDPSLL